MNNRTTLFGERRMEVVDPVALRKRLKEGHEKFIAVFTASWCGYCRILIRELECANPDMPLTLVDISDESCWDEFCLDMVPTAVLYENGKEVRRISSPDGLRLRDLRDLFLSARDK